MSSDIASMPPVGVGSEAAFDFSRRAYLTELMDGPCTYEELRDCLRDLASVNRITLGHRPVLRWLQQFAHRGSGPLHIVDVGCGGGDTLRHIERWAKRKRIPLRLAGIDLNPFATRAACGSTSAASQIHWINGDAFSYDTESNPVDLVISSLFTHHLEDDQIVRFLAWSEHVARRGWFINDLRRSRRSYKLFKLLAHVARWHPFIRHDGPVSIRRAFCTPDWVHYLTDAGVAPCDVYIEEQFPGRLCVGRVKAV